MEQFKETDIMKKIIYTLEKHDFSLNVDHSNDLARHSTKTGSFTFDFLYHYNKEPINITSATYENPEEADFKFTITKISEVYVYDFKNNEIELEEKNLDLITSLIEGKIVDQIIID